MHSGGSPAAPGCRALLQAQARRAAGDGGVALRCVVEVALSRVDAVKLLEDVVGRQCGQALRLGRPVMCSLRATCTPLSHWVYDTSRGAEVCYTDGLNNAGCATRLRRQAKEERRWSDRVGNEGGAALA